MKNKAIKKRLLWFLVFLALVFLTFRALLFGGADFTVQRFTELLLNASPFWMALALLSMGGFVWFEVLSLRHLERFFGHGRSLRRNTVYSAADVFVSAITPSATGGQPASAYFMVKDGIPAAVVTMCLLLNIMLYTVSILLIGLLCFLLAPHVFFAFSVPSRWLIAAGFLFQLLIVIGLFLLVSKEKIILRFAGGVMRLLHKLHLMRNIETRLAALERMAQEYRACIDAFRGGARVVVQVLILNLLQRLCNMSVTLFVYLAVGGSPADTLTVMVTQGFVVLGSNAVPIPGAVGVADLLFLDGFRELIADTACVELISRGISFYVCLLLCGLLTVFAAVKHYKKEHQ